jgi:hypothetical protein
MALNSMIEFLHFKSHSIEPSYETLKRMLYQRQEDEQRFQGKGEKKKKKILHM